jgi:hypothetical protein
MTQGVKQTSMAQKSTKLGPNQFVHRNSRLTGAVSTGQGNTPLKPAVSGLAGRRGYCAVQ